MEYLTLPAASLQTYHPEIFQKAYSIPQVKAV